jgi:nicotinate-nucleotide adenylyltransferase
MTEASRIGLLGGTFDPIHIGHLAAAAVARRALALDRVLLLPSHVPPHRVQPLASVPHRFAMVALAVDGEDGLVASDLELAAPGPSFTSATLRRLQALGHRPSQLFFITGADAFAEIATWRDYPGFLDDANFVVVDRAGRAASSVRSAVPSLASRMLSIAPGAGSEIDVEGQTRILLLDSPTPDVSSTAIRARCAAGQPLTGLVPDAVARHIHRHGLYREGGSPSSVAAGHGPAASQLHEQEHK